MPDLLVELLSEEIPARMQARAADDLRRLVTEGLAEAGLPHGAAAAFATPRRLALAVGGLARASAPRREERRGPRTDAPESALAGFLRAAGVGREALERRADRKGEVWFAVTDRPGRPAAAVVAEVLERVIRTFPWPKSMRWGEGELRWVRPLQSILCILHDAAGAEVVPLEIAGLRAGDTTRGHRFMAPDPIRVASLAEYRAELRRAFVLLDPAERIARIRSEAARLAAEAGLEPVPDDRLLAEIAGLVEWPVVLAGEIAPEFLDLPPEVLRTSMREHQKFLSLREPATGRITRHVVVANRETADGGRTILAGNARVLAARLADARFFWENDLRVARAGMAEWREKLAGTTFHARLGSQAERVERIARLAAEIAPALGADPALAARAAQLAKADLKSAMVGEFPELQGIMGHHYALAAGEAPAVADAIRDHYAPLGPADAVPAAPVTVAVALADKLDMLAGFWAIGEKPTGSGDPFALRRAALGVIRILLDNRLRLPLRRDGGGLLDAAAAIVGAREAGAGPALADTGDLLSFLHERLKVHLRAEGLRHDVIEACLGLPGEDDLVLLVTRVRALDAFLGSGDGANLLTAYRRAANILRDEERRDGRSYAEAPDPGLAAAAEEATLLAALDRAEAGIAPALAAEDFAGAMRAMAALRAPVDAFFERVTVNAGDPALRANRLRLLARIRAVMERAARFAALEG